MKICFPTEKLQGLESVVYEHFGSAPGFVIVDTESKSLEEINNNNQLHDHGMCQPIRALGGHQVDAVAVGGIGMGALMKLKSQGIRVFRVTMGTVRQNIQLMMEKNLAEFDASFTCGGHTGGGCAH